MENIREAIEKKFKDIVILKLKIRIIKWATNFSRDNQQIAGKRNDYFITLQQLESFLKNS